MKNLCKIVMIIIGVTACDVPVKAIGDDVTSAFKLLTKQSEWKLSETVMLDFNAFHTQGMVKIDDHFYVSAVEVTQPTQTYGKSDNLWDFTLTRTVGEGRGWLFKFDQSGALIDKVELTDGAAFHPGGIDYDGEYIWVPVAEYRPNSASSIYRVDPDTMQATLSFNVKDHIGNMVHNTDRGVFYGTSWGSRRIYQWRIDFDPIGKGEVKDEIWHANPTHYIDYQDCQYQATNYMLCAGVQKYQTPQGEMQIGGIELIDLSEEILQPVHLLPVAEYIDDEMIVTNNPFWAEVDGDKMRFYFMPDNKRNADLLVYELDRSTPK